MRPKGIPNSRAPKPKVPYHRMVVEVSPVLYERFSSMCYDAGISVTARITEHMRRDITPLTTGQANPADGLGDYWAEGGDK